MYVIIVFALMLIFPLLSIVVQVILTDRAALGATAYLAIIAKWYVFWALGVRLSAAGARQIIQPRYTAETILGRGGDDSMFFVRELGFANLAIGCVGLGSLFTPSWVTPAAMLGAIFYGLAGINHAAHRARGKLQNLAMGSDLFAAVVLAICCFA